MLHIINGLNCITNGLDAFGHMYREYAAVGFRFNPFGLNPLGGHIVDDKGGEKGFRGRDTNFSSCIHVDAAVDVACDL